MLLRHRFLTVYDKVGGARQEFLLIWTKFREMVS